MFRSVEFRASSGRREDVVADDIPGADGKFAVCQTVNSDNGNLGSKSTNSSSITKGIETANESDYPIIPPSAKNKMAAKHSTKRAVRKMDIKKAARMTHGVKIPKIELLGACDF
ncbi:hypothetical protein FS837_012470 [Tulasnella sp. UAMH 9824]|nr:hypothetical protein FS837_012470 [Tulasnella sp. UAMH 9824]